MSNRDIGVALVWAGVLTLWVGLLLLAQGCGASRSGISIVPVVCPEPAETHPSVAMIETDTGGRHCTAWAYSPRRLLTNKHCVPPGSGTEALSWKGRRFAVLRYPPPQSAQDYVILVLVASEPDVTPLPLGGRLDEPTAWILGSGCTGSAGVQRKRLVADYGYRGCVCRGDSGAPVLDSQGRVWGMNRSAYSARGTLGARAHVQALREMDLWN